MTTQRTLSSSRRITLERRHRVLDRKIRKMSNAFFLTSLEYQQLKELKLRKLALREQLYRLTSTAASTRFS